MTVDTNMIRRLADASAPAGDALRDAARDAADEIDRLIEREATLLELLAEARPAVDGELATVALIESGDPVALLDLLARIDAALVGGEEA